MDWQTSWSAHKQLRCDLALDRRYLKDRIYDEVKETHSYASCIPSSEWMIQTFRAEFAAEMRTSPHSMPSFIPPSSSIPHCFNPPRTKLRTSGVFSPMPSPKTIACAWPSTAKYAPTVCRTKHSLNMIHAVSMKRLSKIETADDPIDRAGDE
jgi:hypothetical protein